MAVQDYVDKMLSSFLRSFPTYQLHSKPQSKYDYELWVFSSKDDEGSQNNSYSFSDDVGTRIISAFSKVRTETYCSMAQLWAPVTIGGSLLLSTYRQPFAVAFPNEYLLKYRGRCEEYGYSNNVILDDMIEQDEDRRPKIISNGPLLSAFFSRLPELLFMKTSVQHEAGPLLGYGYEECKLRTSWMMPIWDSSRSSSSSSDCIGVVEYSSLRYYDLQVFNLMKEALEEVRLRVFNVQDRIPYQTISGLKPTKEQIQKALETISESHAICLAQVWISSEDNNHEHFSSSLIGTQMKQMLALKLTGYISPSERLYDIDWLSDYYDACDMIPLKKGDELVLKTFQDYEPRFYKDNSKLGTDILLAGFSDEDTRCNGLTICMRNIDTREFDYAFEFIWWHNSDYIMFLEALLLTLKRCLPRFKCASGAELGDELHVIDVDNSTKSETKKFKIFQGNGSSPTAEAMEKGKKAMVVDYKESSPTAEAMEKGKKAMVVDYKEPFTAKRDTKEKLLSREKILQQYGKTFKEAATALGVSVSTLKRKRDQLRMGAWQGPELPQRKANNSSKNQSMRSQTNEECNDTIQDPSLVNKNEDEVTIKADYNGDMKKFHLSISEATFVTVENIISTEFELTFSAFKLKYLDEDGDWIVLASDRDINDCIKCSKKVDRIVVRLLVLLHDH